MRRGSKHACAGVNTEAGLDLNRVVIVSMVHLMQHFIFNTSTPCLCFVIMYTLLIIIII